LSLAKPTKEVKFSTEKDNRDLTIITDDLYGELIAKINKILAENDVEAKISPVSIYQPENHKKHITVHLEFNQKIDDALMQKLETI
jgi:excinuclease UvrABC helicase subunit UvrB